MEMVKLSFDKDLRDAATNVSTNHDLPFGEMNRCLTECSLYSN